MLARSTFVLGAALALGACHDGDGYRRFDRDISFAAAEALLAQGPRRIDLRVAPAPGFVLAHAFQLEEPDELFEDELLAGPLRSVITLEGADGCRGTLALGAPGVVVRFDETFTDFGGQSCAELVARIEELLARGATPRLVARRQPAPVPQAPDDATFIASTLVIDEDNVEPAALAEIELNVQPENVLACDLLVDRPSDCAGAVRLLDQVVAVSHEITDVETEDPTEIMYVDVNDEVRNVDPNDRTLVLADGRRVRFVDATVIDGGTLGEIEERIAAGEAIRLDATTAVQPTAPIALVAIEASFSASPGGDAGDQVIVVQGEVLDVEPELGLITMALGTDVRVTEQSAIEGDFESLDALDRSIGAGTLVRAEAIGPIEAREPRLVVRADRLRLAARAPQ